MTISVSTPEQPAGGGANLRSVQPPPRSRGTKSVREQGRDVGTRSSPPPPPPPPYHLDGDLVQTILAGQTRAQPVEITWVDDEVDGPDTTVTFAATVENDLRVRPPRSAQIKVNDDDDTPAVTLHLAPDAIAEDGGATVVTATLDRLSSADTTVRVSAAPVAPAQAGDFALSGDTVLTIAAQADTSSGTLTITALDNDVDAAPKTVTVSGKASNDQGVIDPADVTLTIEDDDHSPVFGAATPRAVAENTAAGTDIGAPVAATDQDAGDTLSYRLLGTDAAVFDVVAATGQLRTEAALDYEARDAYTVTVEADDGNGNRGDVSVTIDVTDVDEPPGEAGRPHRDGGVGDQPAGDVDGTGEHGTADHGLRLPLPDGRSGGKLDGSGGHHADGADGDHRLAEREHGLRRVGAGDERRGHGGVVGAGYGSDGRQRGARVHGGVGEVRGGGEPDRGGDGAGERRRRRRTV